MNTSSNSGLRQYGDLEMITQQSDLSDPVLRCVMESGIDDYSSAVVVDWDLFQDMALVNKLRRGIERKEERLLDPAGELDLDHLQTCEYCNRRYPPRKKTQKYCCQPCHYASRTVTRPRGTE